MRHVSDKGLLFIAREEGVVLNAYKDSVGVWTIGVGHTKGAGDPVPKAGMEITFDEAIELFRKDIEKYERDVYRALREDAPQNVFDAAVSFHYNTGGIHRASWVRAYNAGASASEVRKRFMYWRKPKEIIPRRKREANLLINGDYGDLSKIPVYRATHSGRVIWSSVTHVNGEDILKRPVNVAGEEKNKTEEKEQARERKTLWATLMELIGKMFSRTQA